MLYRFKENDRSWMAADAIISGCSNPRSIYFALVVSVCCFSFDSQLLEDMVQTRWQVIPVEQRESVKNFALNQVMSVRISIMCEL